MQQPLGLYQDGPDTFAGLKATLVIHNIGGTGEQTRLSPVYDLSGSIISS